jgi:hypothetical protein
VTTLDLALTESRTLRAQHVTKTDVLDKVKALALLPDGIHATTEMVAGYYEVTPDAIKKVVQRNRDELKENGLQVLRGAELRDFKRDLTEGQVVPLSGNVNSLMLFPRRAILNVGELLTDSPVAERIRTYLLDVEEIAPAELRVKAVEMAAIGRAQLRMLEAASGLVRDASWLDSKARIVVARSLGEEPEIDPLDRPLYVPDFLKEKGLTRKQIRSEQSWFGRRVVEAAEADGVRVPELRDAETADGSLRGTKAWTHRHLPYFDQVWDRYLAPKYDTRPAVLL